jgi:transposase
MPKKSESKNSASLFSNCYWLLSIINLALPSNRRKCAAQDGRRLRRYAKRWLVERFFAWIQWQRRILVRWEFYPKNFLGFVQLACLVVLFKRF